MRQRACTFCNARFSVLLPPCTVNLGTSLVFWMNEPVAASTMSSMEIDRWLEPISDARRRARSRVAAEEFKDAI